MTKKIDKFISKNRTMIDEFIGPNQDKYIEISLKGELVSKIGKKYAFMCFEYWDKKKLSIQEKCKRIREMLGMEGIDENNEYEFLDETLHFLDEEEDEEIIQDVIEQAIEEEQLNTKYKIVSSEKYNDGVCQKCGTWHRIYYKVTIKNLYCTHTFDLCYSCFNWLHETYDIE